MGMKDMGMKDMGIFVPRAGVCDSLPGNFGSLFGMAVRMEVNRAVAMTMAVKMHAVAPQPPQHMCAEADQHDTDGGFQRPRPMFGDRLPDQDRGTGKDEQGQGMAKPPGQAVLDDIADIGASRRDARYRRDMVGLERMLHPEQKPQSENSEHLFPNGLDRWRD